LERVLTNDPGIGVARHADAGYDKAIKVAQEKGIKIPMLKSEFKVKDKPVPILKSSEES